MMGAFKAITRRTQMETMADLLERAELMLLEQLTRIEELESAMWEFCNRCDRGEIRSTYTYKRFKELLTKEKINVAPRGKMRVFKCRYEILGTHVHCRLFSSDGIDYTFAKLGDVCMDLKDWEDFKQQFPSFIFQPESD